MKPTHVVITTKWGTYPVHRNWLEVELWKKIERIARENKENS